MLVLTNNECDELEKIVDGYVVGLNSLNKQSDEYDNLKELLDNKLCGLEFLEERKICSSEIDLGNVIIENDILICIFDNALHKFKMIKRKANDGEYAYILSAREIDSFHNKYIRRCFKTIGQPSTDYVYVEDSTEERWLLYDDQYVVLEEI